MNPQKNALHNQYARKKHSLPQYKYIYYSRNAIIFSLFFGLFCHL